MKKERAISSLSTLSVCCIIIGIIFLCVGFYKHLFYDDSSYHAVNAYVGGDAYNYIINGTYFIAYSVLSAGSFIIAAITGVASKVLSIEKEESEVIEVKQTSTIQDIEENLPLL